MKEDNKAKPTSEEVYDKTWLKRLQGGSWELELLVTGFSIVLIYTGVQNLADFTSFIENNFNSAETTINLLLVLTGLIMIGFYAIIINLVFFMQER